MAHDTPYIPATWKRGVLILGESAYHGGTVQYQDILASRWVPRYLAGLETDRTYTKVANAIGPSRDGFWKAHAFANLVILPEGSRAKEGVTRQQFESSVPWLRETLLEYRPCGVWIWGIEQSRYSAPVLEDLRIPHEVAKHPTSYGITHAYLSESWRCLMTKMGSVRDNDA